MRIPHFVPLLSLPLLTSSAFAHSQSNEPTTTSSREIVVEGREIRAMVSDFVDRMLPVHRTSQFGRFEDPVCPKVVGVGKAAEKEIADRMVAVGRFVDIEVKQQPCSPNLFLLVMPDKKSAIDGLKQSRPEYLKGVSPNFLERSIASPRAYMAWQMLALYTADGMSVVGGNSMPSGSNGAQLVVGGQPQGDKYQDANSSRVRTTLSPSRMRSNVKPHVMSAVVLVESRALANLTTRQLADFAFMQAMMPSAHDDDGPPASSILSVLSTQPVPDEAPQSVTRSDVAFLKALRGVRSDTYSLVQKNEIRGQMISELNKAGVEAKD